MKLDLPLKDYMSHCSTWHHSTTQTSHEDTSTDQICRNPASCLTRRNRIAVTDSLGAFCTAPFSPRAYSGTGPLSGLRFAVKDLIDVTGHITGGGNPDWANDHGAAAADAPVVAALLKAGATLIGKTVTDELAFSLDGRNTYYGTPLNAAAPTRLPGGSSSGSAAAVAGGLADFALGTDTGGSVRVPASFCGLFGFRPSHGLVSTEGVIPFAPSFDTVGWFARDGTLLAKIGRVLLPASAMALPMRALLCRDAFQIVDAALRDQLAADANNVLTRLGIAIRDEVYLTDDALTAWRNAYGTLQGDEIRQSLGPWIRAKSPRFGPNIEPRFASLEKISVKDVAAAKWRRVEVQHRLDTLLKNAILVLPTAPFAAPDRDIDENELGPLYPRLLALTAPASLGSLPQVTLPLTRTEDGPAGLSLIGPRGSDEALLVLATAISSTAISS